MQNHALVLKNYAKNFHLLNDISQISQINYFDNKKIVIITDKNLKNILEIKKLLDFFIKKYNVKIIFLNAEEPNYKMIENTSKKIHNNKYNLAIAIGGGSVLDVTKASSMFENSVENVDNFAGSKKKYKKKMIKSVAIPTTAGTGSEFTHTSVYKTRLNIKNWLWDELTYFDQVIYIPTLTLNLPKSVTIAAGVDAIDHLIESLISVKFDFKNLNFCNYGIKTIWESLPKLNHNLNNIRNRTSILLGSGIAGKAIHLTGCGICHCIAHTLGSLTKIPHGVAVAYALLHTIEPVLKHKDDLFLRFDGSLKRKSSTLLAKDIRDWIMNLNINFKLIENKIEFDKFIEIYQLNDNKSMRDNTYYQPTEFELKSMLKSLWI